MFGLTSHHRLSRRPPGFSLVEALVATAIIALGLVAVVGIFPFSLQVNKGSEQGTLASTYAKTKLEDLLTTPYDEITVGTLEPRTRLSSDPTNPAYHLDRQTIVALVDSNLAPSAADQGLKKVTVTVFWSDRRGHDNALVLTSLVASK